MRLSGAYKIAGPGPYGVAADWVMTWDKVADMKTLFLVAGAAAILSSTAVAHQYAVDESTSTTAGAAMTVAMGPLSAPQKRGPPVAGPNSDPAPCKRSHSTCGSARPS